MKLINRINAVGESTLVKVGVLFLKGIISLKGKLGPTKKCSTAGVRGFQGKKKTQSRKECDDKCVWRDLRASGGARMKNRN